MKKLSLLLLLPLFLLSSCNKKEIAFKKIKYLGDEIFLVCPIYKQNDHLYCDVEEISNMFKCASFSWQKTAEGENYTKANVVFDKYRIVFTVNTTRVNIIKNLTEITYRDLSAPCNGKSAGMDVPIDDYCDILGYQHSTDNEFYIITK